MTPEPEYTVCYRHPRKVAVQNCKLCSRPICMQCASESGDPLFCLPCKQDTILHGDRLLKEGRPPQEATPPQEARLPEGARDDKQDSQPEARLSTFEMGDVTVLDDGTVVQPGAPESSAQRPEDSSVGQGTPPPPPPALVQREKEGLLPAMPAADPEPGAVTTPPTGTATTAPAGRTGEKQPVLKAEKPVMGKPPRTGLFNQLLYATLYAVAVAALISGTWLLIAFGTKQWTQISVFTLGLAVPWALYNSTTRKKYLGARVWTERPPVIFISVISFAVVMIFTVAMEFLARWVIFGNRFPVSDFFQRYFKTLDCVLVVCGLALAALTPFVLKMGSDLAAPSFRKKGTREPESGEDEKVERKGDRQPEQKAAEGAEPDAALKSGLGPRDIGTDKGSKPAKWR